MLTGTEIDLAAVRGETSASSAVACEAELVAFTDAVMARDPAAIDATRRALEAALGPRGVVDTAAVIAAFNVVDRVADATGIPIDDNGVKDFREQVGKEVGLADFHPDLRSAR